MGIGRRPLFLDANSRSSQVSCRFSKQASVRILTPCLLGIEVPRFLPPEGTGQAVLGFLWAAVAVDVASLLPGRGRTAAEMLHTGFGLLAGFAASNLHASYPVSLAGNAPSVDCLAGKT